MKGRVIVIDDEKNMGLVIGATLERAGFEVMCFQEPKEALDLIESEEFDAIVTDLYMPGVSGMEVLAHARRHQPQVPIVMITAFGTVESAVSALKNGAFDFITKPFDQSELLNVIEKACLTSHERQKEPAPHSELMTPENREPARVSRAALSDELSFTGKSPKVMELRRMIEKVAPTDSTVLIEGESGTGKELVAQEIHNRSRRAERALIKVNCAVIPAPLIESELFGYERGAFTGAVSSKPGRFELAHEGTLFLDEVGEMPLEMQAKLLRAIQEQEFERVGGLSTIRVNVRLVAATNRNLAQEVRAGRFREDLFYRLNVVPIELPPLRERREDIPVLVAQFILRFNTKFGKRVRSVDAEGMRALERYRWPGNIRQLENTMERMVLMGGADTLSVRDLPEEIAAEVYAASGGKAPGEEDAIPGFKETVRRQTQATERNLIEKALEESDGNVTRTAEKLGLSRKGLQLKIKELGIRRVIE